MIPSWLIAILLAPFAVWCVSELRKISKTGVIDDGGDWDWHQSDEPIGFYGHALLLIAPIFGFAIALISTLIEFSR